VVLRGSQRFLPYPCFFFSAACEHRTTLVDPDAPSDSVIDDDGGTVQKATLTVTVSVMGPDLPGRYAISVIRVLTAGELELIGAGGADLNAFAGAKSVEVEAPSSETVVWASAGQRGSLVISELFNGKVRMSGGEWYNHSQFIELYNNSAATIYLDGKVLVKGLVYMRDYSWGACDILQRYLNDAEGIWTNRYVVAFPGSGQEYPLAPGQVAVVAMDAIDHRQFHPDLHDLSNADFELTEEGDPDNPAVPNMLVLGRQCCGGHGLRWDWTQEVVFVAGPVDVSSLPRDTPPLIGEIWQIPGGKILDVLAATATPEIEAVHSAQFGPLCPRIVHENFDRQPAAIVDSQSLEGIQRRVFTVLPDGRKILQRTKTSSRDYVGRYPATPGFIPE